MSKASDWLNAKDVLQQHVADRPVLTLRFSGFNGGNPEGVRARVYDHWSTSNSPMLELKPDGGESIIFDFADACELARWILVIFTGEVKP